jgi:hypothetical protein
MIEEWKTIEHALNYLHKIDKIPHRTEGESVLLEEISPQSGRVLDISAGEIYLREIAYSVAAT